MNEELLNYAGCDALLSANNKTKIDLIHHSVLVSTIGVSNWTRKWYNLIQSVNRKLSAVKR